MPELSGEQKLRIVLESIIRKVPKEEQCEKYGISEAEFLSWQEHLTTNGGKIFEPNFGRSSKRVKTIQKMGKTARIFLTLSILLNLGLITVAGVFYFTQTDKVSSVEVVKDSKFSEDSPLHSAEPDNDFSEMEEPEEEETSSVASSQVDELLSSAKDEQSLSAKANLETLLAKPLELPTPKVLSPVDVLPEISSEVSFLNEVYEGRHVVYILDVGDYVLQGEGAAQRFEKMKDAVLSSLVTLSPNSYFNLVLYWNLRETSALGKTILKANRDNVKYAIDWITGLGSSIEDLKENRNQFVPKELLYSKPLSGVVGPWFGLGVGITFDPDLIFVLAGNSAAFPMNAVPKSHFNGLDLTQRSLLSKVEDPVSNHSESAVSDLTRQTARKWLVSMEPSGSLPDNIFDIEKIALKRLGLSSAMSHAHSSVAIPWEKVFENFLSSLELNAQMIPQSHFFLCLPPHVRWPNDLFNTASEFAESSKGTLIESPEFP